jgi:hypothetical protein
MPYHSNVAKTKTVFNCNIINFGGSVAVEGILCKNSGNFSPIYAGRKLSEQAVALKIDRLLLLKFEFVKFWEYH